MPSAIPKSLARTARLMPLLILLSACGNDTENEAIRQYAQAAAPADPELAEIYERSCRSCHARSQSGAPLTGDHAHWAKLLAEKSMDTLVDNTVDGYGGMPPMGHCMDCDREEFKALIQFMAQAPEDNSQEPDA